MKFGAPRKPAIVYSLSLAQCKEQLNRDLLRSCSGQRDKTFNESEHSFDPNYVLNSRTEKGPCKLLICDHLSNELQQSVRQFIT